MLLSSFIGKKIYEKGAYKGTCVAILIHKKSRVVRFLSCRNGRDNFYLPFSSVDYATDVIRLKNCNPTTPKGCETFSIGLPVYDDTGKKMGELKDIDVENFMMVEIILNDGEKISAALILSCKDAILIKKAPPFPLARRIPTCAKNFLSSKEKFISKKTLRTLASNGNLIKFTLALLMPLDGVFCR